MRLRNKKTGEIVDFITIDLTGEGEIEFVFIAPDGDERGWKYNSLESFNEEWEDYKPAEPLIKDEKIRKAVRAWADNLQAFMCDGEITFYDDKAYRTFQTDVWKGCNIRDIAELDLVFDEDSLEDGKIYTIAELCGEEEE